MPKPPKPIKAFKHKHEKRAHVPSSEEAGYEDANPKVQDAPNVATFPRNPIVHRGQDPELFWMHKYGSQDTNAVTEVDVRSLYRHEHIAPEQLIRGLYKIVESNPDQSDFFRINELFGNALEHSELEKIGDYYTHSDGWTNRLIQGDSQLVMTSLLEREGMAGKVQCIYVDPPYGIKYGSNWQIRLNNRTVKDDDDSLTGEPEMVKAYRDTWELGIHSYLSYLRDRLLVARELLHESGSCFIQISDENVHLVRSLLDEVFGSGNFCSLIFFRKTGGQSSSLIASVGDYLIWYAKNAEQVKYRPLFSDKASTENRPSIYCWLESPDGKVRRKMTRDEREERIPLPEGWRIFAPDTLCSLGPTPSGTVNYVFEGKTFHPGANQHWKTTVAGLDQLKEAKRLINVSTSLYYVRYLEDFPVTPRGNMWEDTSAGGYSDDKVYVVQTNRKVVQRCLLMTTIPAISCSIQPAAAGPLPMLLSSGVDVGSRSTLLALL